MSAKFVSDKLISAELKAAEQHLSPLLHGGDLIHASEATGIPQEDWLDLSTGISPYAYPFKDLAVQAFTDLPYLSPGFFEQVSTYYGSRHFMPVPGTQAAIQALPELLEKLPILLPSTGYQEHARAWQNSAHSLAYYHALDAVQAHAEIQQQLARNSAQHLLIINPNNPTTLCFSCLQLSAWARQLTNGACLIVDEAFIDTHVNASMIPFLSDNIIVLRSFGKFFGLAGIRLGFVFASETILSRLQTKLPLWSINGPAAHIAEQALADVQWQNLHQDKLAFAAQQSIRLFDPLAQTEVCKRVLHESLFSSYLFERKAAESLFEHFYQQGILLRLIPLTDQQAIIRVGRALEERHAQLLSSITGFSQTRSY